MFLINIGISVSKNNVHYFNAIPCDGIFEIDMRGCDSNYNSMYTDSIESSMTCTLLIFGTIVLLM